MPAPSRRGSVAFSWRPRGSGSDRGLALGELIDLDEAQIVLCDLPRPGGAVDLAVNVGLQRVPPDRAPDREADEALDGSRRHEPLVDLLIARAAAEDHAGDAIAPARASLGDEHLAVRALLHR